MKKFLALFFVISSAFANSSLYEQHEDVTTKLLNNKILLITINLNYKFDGTEEFTCEDWKKSLNERYSNLATYNLTCEVDTHSYVEYGGWAGYYNDDPNTATTVTKRVGLKGKAEFLRVL